MTHKFNPRFSESSLSEQPFPFLIFRSQEIQINESFLQHVWAQRQDWGGGVLASRVWSAVALIMWKSVRTNVIIGFQGAKFPCFNKNNWNFLVYTKRVSCKVRLADSPFYLLYACGFCFVRHLFYIMYTTNPIEFSVSGGWVNLPAMCHKVSLIAG